MSRNQGAVSGETNARRRWAFRLTILVVLTAAFVTSFKAGSHGAFLFGFPPEFLFTAPLICDIVAGLATLVHGWARDDAPMRTLAATFVLVPMGLSWIANAADHLDRAQPVSTWPVLGQMAWIGAVILFAGLCPVAVASLLFFSTRFGEFERREAQAKVSRSETAQVSAEVEVNTEDEPEFVEPEPIPQRVLPPTTKTAPAEVEVNTEDEPTADAMDDELTELLRIEQAMAEHRVTRDIAEIMVREGVSRATAYRRRGGANASVA